MVESKQVQRSPNYPKSYLRVPSFSLALAPEDVQSLHEGAPARGATELGLQVSHRGLGVCPSWGGAGTLENAWGPQTELLQPRPG